MSKKMSDVFLGRVHGISVRNDALEVTQCFFEDEREDELSSSMVMGYAAHAINSHDSLTAEVERLREALNMAKTSMLDSGYSKESTILMVINKALEGGDE